MYTVYKKEKNVKNQKNHNKNTKVVIYKQHIRNKKKEIRNRK